MPSSPRYQGRVSSLLALALGASTAAKGLAEAPIDVVVIDRRSHHLFQPQTVRDAA